MVPEIERTRIMLINNHYPQLLVEQQINKFINCKLNISTNKEIEDINLFNKNQMTYNYKLEERTLKAIIKKNTKSTNCDTQIRLNIYCKNRKLSNLVIKNSLSNKTTNI